MNEPRPQACLNLQTIKKSIFKIMVIIKEKKKLCPCDILHNY